MLRATTSGPRSLTSNKATSEPECLRADQLAKLLGVNRKTVYEYAARNVIPHQRLGRRIVFSRAGRGMVGRMQGVADREGYLVIPVRRTSDGRWRYRVVVELPNGEQARISGSAPRHNNTKDAARQAEKDHILRVLTESTAPKPEPAKEAPTLNEFSKTYLEISAVKNKPSSVNTKGILLRTHLLPALGHLKLDQVTYGVIEDLKVKLSQTPLANAERRWNDVPKPKNEIRYLCAKTINNCFTVLRRMLSIAV